MLRGKKGEKKGKNKPQKIPKNPKLPHSEHADKLTSYSSDPCSVRKNLVKCIRDNGGRMLSRRSEERRVGKECRL